MRFEREINIYGDEVILKRFRANETSVEIIQGKIAALISESEIIELENSQATMYSKLASAIMDIDALTLNFSDLTTKYNTVSGQYTSLDSKVAQYKAGVDGLSANITSVQTNVESLITWKNEASLKITDSAIISTVTQSSTYESSVNSLIEQKASSIRLKATTISWSSTYSSMTSSGTLTCRNATIEGTIHSDNGDDEIYMRSARLDFIRDGADVGNIGTNVYSADNSKRGLTFDLEYDAAYMAWGVKKTSSAQTYTMMWAYANKTVGNYDAGMLHAGCDIDMHYYEIRNLAINNISSIQGIAVLDGSYNVVTQITDNGDGTISWRYGTVRIRDGLVTSWPT